MINGLHIQILYGKMYIHFRTAAKTDSFKFSTFCNSTERNAGISFKRVDFIGTMCQQYVDYAYEKILNLIKE